MSDVKDDEGIDTHFRSGHDPCSVCNNRTCAAITTDASSSALSSLQHPFHPSTVVQCGSVRTGIYHDTPVAEWTSHECNRKRKRFSPAPQGQRETIFFSNVEPQGDGQSAFSIQAFEAELFHGPRMPQSLEIVPGISTAVSGHGTMKWNVGDGLIKWGGSGATSAGSITNHILNGTL